MKDGAVVRCGTIHCVNLGHRRYSSDLKQRGLEVPFSLSFKGKKKEVARTTVIVTFTRLIITVGTMMIDILWETTFYLK